MSSVERVIEYTELPPEAPLITSTKPPKGWPEKGAIKASELTIRYRPDLDDVIKGISFEVKGGERIGIVGRTGSGKSTMMSALFRLSKSDRLLVRSMIV